MIKLKDLLKEEVEINLNSISAEEFADTLAKAYYNDWLREKMEFGDDYPEVNNLDYLIGGLEHDMETMWQRGFPDFLYKSIKKGNISNELIDLQPQNCSSIQHGCYYNALDFILRTDREDVFLAYGFFVHKLFKYLTDDESKVEGYSLNFDMMLHSFIVTDDEKIFDPTLPHEEITKDEYYAWETVPESVYKDFDHKFNDENYDASDFYDYIESEVESYKGSMNLKDKIRKIHQENS